MRLVVNLRRISIDRRLYTVLSISVDGTLSINVVVIVVVGVLRMVAVIMWWSRRIKATIWLMLRLMLLLWGKTIIVVRSDGGNLVICNLLPEYCCSPSILGSFDCDAVADSSSVSAAELVWMQCCYSCIQFWMFSLRSLLGWRSYFDCNTLRNITKSFSGVDYLHMSYLYFP